MPVNNSGKNAVMQMIFGGKYAQLKFCFVCNFQPKLGYKLTFFNHLGVFSLQNYGESWSIRSHNYFSFSYLKDRQLLKHLEMGLHWKIGFHGWGVPFSNGLFSKICVNVILTCFNE